MARYLVTGATGFLGSHLARRLSERGDEVVALVRPKRDGAPRPSLIDGANVIVRTGDILDDASLRAASEGCDGVFHCAGRVSREPEDAEALYRVHVEGTKAVVAACRAARVKRLVIASTSGTVAVGEDPHHLAAETDETPLHLIARWPYYRSKLFAERAALEANGGGLEVVSVNPSLLLGPGDVHGSSTGDVRLFLERRVPAIPPGGLSFVDARDAAEAMVLAMERGTPGERYLVTACNLTIRELLGRLERLSGVKGPWLPIPRAPELTRAGAQLTEKLAQRLGLSLPVDRTTLDIAQYFFYVDCTRAERELGWTSRDPNETLADTIADLRARGVVWPEEGSRPASRGREGAHTQNGITGTTRGETAP